MRRSVSAFLATVVLAWGPLPGVTAADPEPKLERRVTLPLKAGRRADFPAWVGFDATGRYLAAAYRVGYDGARLAVWDATADRVVRDAEIPKLNYSNTDFGLRAAFHPAGSHVLTFGFQTLEGLPLGAAKNGLMARTVDRGTSGLGSRRSMFWVGDRVIRHATVYSDKTLYIDTLDPDAMRYDPTDLRTAKSFAAGKKFALEGTPALLELDRAGARAAWVQQAADAVEDPDVVRVLDLESGTSRALASERPILAVACLAFSPDGRSVVSGGRDGFVRLWAAGDGREKWCVAVHEYTMGSAAFAPDGGLLACGSLKDKDANLIFYEPETGKVVWAGTIEKGGVIGLAFGPTGDKLAVLAGSGVIYVYDVTSLRRGAGKR